MKIRSFFRTAGLALLLFAVFFSLLYVAKLSPDVHININPYATSDVAYADGRTAHFDNKISADWTRAMLPRCISGCPSSRFLKTPYCASMITTP